MEFHVSFHIHSRRFSVGIHQAVDDEMTNTLCIIWSDANSAYSPMLYCLNDKRLLARWTILGYELARCSRGRGLIVVVLVVVGKRRIDIS